MLCQGFTSMTIQLLKLQKMLHLAKQASQNAYAPYSNFHVGACILSDSDNFYCGCNVENISYPVGTCAEAGAVSAMVVGGDTKIKEILIYASSKELKRRVFFLHAAYIIRTIPAISHLYDNTSKPDIPAARRPRLNKGEKPNDADDNAA